MVSKSRNPRRLEFEYRLERWIVRTKLVPTRVRFRHMTRLWGVCNPDNSITFAMALLDQAHAFQDLVIVHELVHLRIRDHSVFFWTALKLYHPDWRAVSRLAPETPAHVAVKQRLEDCMKQNPSVLGQNYARNPSLTPPHSRSYCPDHGDANSN